MVGRPFRSAAAAGQQGVVRRDPFAMLPFCGYNMGDYFAHWLSMPGRTDEAKLPRIYFVNWFRKKDGKFVWPGYGENARVLKWIFERLDGVAEAKDTPIGRLPTVSALDTEGLTISSEALDLLLSVDPEIWTEEASLIPGHYEKFGDRLPQRLWDEYAALIERLGAARSGKPMKAAAARGVTAPRATAKTDEASTAS